MALNKTQWMIIKRLTKKETTMGGFNKLLAPVKEPPEQKPDTSAEKDADQRREEAIRRGARGRSSLIATGPRGVLDAVVVPPNTRGKKLLGE